MQGMLDAWTDPHMRHAMLVHLPIVFGGLGILPLLALALTGFRSVTLKLVCVAWFALASAGAGLAAGAGEAAEEALHTLRVPLTGASGATLERHEELGEGGWIWPLIPAALVAVTLVPVGPKRRAIPIAAGLAAIAASLGVGWWVAATSHTGGELVYVHGVGAPSPSLAAGAGDTPAASGDQRRHDDDD
jgi:uncharacterized membrane protein